MNSLTLFPHLSFPVVCGGSHDPCCSCLAHYPEARCLGRHCSPAGALQNRGERRNCSKSWRHPMLKGNSKNTPCLLLGTCIRTKGVSAGEDPKVINVQRRSSGCRKEERSPRAPLMLATLPRDIFGKGVEWLKIFLSFLNHCKALMPTAARGIWISVGGDLLLLFKGDH